MKRLFLITLIVLLINLGYSQTARLDAYIDSVMLGRRIPGLQLGAVNKGKFIVSGSYGVTHIEDEVAVDDATVFAVNSITKAFAGVAVMQLVEEGKYDWMTALEIIWIRYLKLGRESKVTI